MATKPKSDVKVLKGQEAEDKILDYLKRMNRPFGAVDVAANLKGAVPKTATQKILVALAEKGELVQKTYGKTTFFVANQANIKSVAADEITALEAELKETEEDNKLKATAVKSLTAELTKIKNAPTDQEIEAQLSEVTQAVKDATARLLPLRAGTTLVSPEEIAQTETEWTKWRAEWIRRKRVFMTSVSPPFILLVMGYSRRTLTRHSASGI
ncbi:hypothetical protein HGRIS_002388 [Hohenbuehelia grisea]|uniref:Homologous-pairing protein 2 winged helix domain-containing protein n=1 Tax=Hohenbuehelia grisea TaxID=104357 RepID=A0ABR3JKJ0_9AGAR